jgi:hypothetical protein
MAHLKKFEIGDLRFKIERKSNPKSEIENRKFWMGV